MFSLCPPIVYLEGALGEPNKYVGEKSILYLERISQGIMTLN